MMLHENATESTDFVYGEYALNIYLYLIHFDYANGPMDLLIYSIYVWMFVYAFQFCNMDGKFMWQYVFPLHYFFEETKNKYNVVFAHANFLLYKSM